MSRQFPKRTQPHNLEELSERYFNQCLPDNWTSDKPAADYGVDLHVEIFEGENAKGLELLIQLKSSENAIEEDYETVRLRTSTYNYLWDKLLVVMLVKYVKEENEAYWLLLSDVPEPNQKQDTFTIRIPKTNKLSNIDWKRIEQYVYQITDEKLAAVRRKILRRKKQ